MKSARIESALLAVCCTVIACSGSESPVSPAVGGALGLGGNGAGGSAASASGGVLTATGGNTLVASVLTTSGGMSSSGLLTATGGVPAAGGATASGGSKSTGGASSLGGTSAAGGSKSTGGASSLGGTSAAGGSKSTGGTTGTCQLPTTFKWTSTGPLSQPKPGWVALKDFSSIVYNNQHIVYMSTVDNSGAYGGAVMTFTDWPQMATATQSPLPYGGIAPTLVYFRPKNIWVLMYEWGPWSFTYLTSTDPTSASGWAGPFNLYGSGSFATVEFGGQLAI